MKFAFPGITILLAAVLGGCSSVPTKVNKGPVQATTYSLMSSKAASTFAQNPRREEVQKTIQSSIARTLEQKGLKWVASGGDVQVAYLVIVGDNATTTTYDDYFGYGRDAAKLANKAHKVLSGNKSRDYFEVGALVIDVLDPAGSKLLYRSYVHTDVQTITPENRAARIQQLVDSCLGDLRVTQ